MKLKKLVLLAFAGILFASCHADRKVGTDGDTLSTTVSGVTDTSRSDTSKIDTAKQIAPPANTGK